MGENGSHMPLKVSKLQVYEGMQLKEVDEVQTGDIVVLAGIDDVKIGDTICNQQSPQALPRIHVDEPTVSMTFSFNNSPLGGLEGRTIQFSRIRERLLKETLVNVAISVEETEERGSIVVRGRGEFQLAIYVTPFITYLGTVIKGDQVVNDTSVVMTVTGPSNIDPVDVDAFRVLPTFPNPFSEVARIGFYTPFSDRINLKVFNILGEMMYEETQGVSPGEYYFRFDGNELPPGTYFYRITHSSQYYTGKFIKSR